MPIYDFECVDCKVKDRITLPVIPKEMPKPECCGKFMCRIYQPTNFSVRGYNTSNGFNKDSDGWREKLSLNK